MLQDLKQFFQDNEKDIVLIIGIILISLISFGAGRISAPGIPKYPITIEERQLQAAVNQNIASESESAAQNSKNVAPNANAVQNNADCPLIGSKNSNKYHYPWCAGAKNISEKNKICFSSKEEAQNRGYQPASNCAGLK